MGFIVQYDPIEQEISPSYGEWSCQFLSESRSKDCIIISFNRKVSYSSSTKMNMWVVGNVSFWQIAYVRPIVQNHGATKVCNSMYESFIFYQNCKCHDSMLEPGNISHIMKKKILFSTAEYLLDKIM